MAFRIVFDRDGILFHAHLPGAWLSDGIRHARLEEHPEHPAARHHPAFWTSFLLRVYALEGSSARPSPEHALLWLGIIHQPLQIMRTTFAVYWASYILSAFMVLPLFATLEKLDHSLLEASATWEAAWRAFIDVTLPLSMPGIIAGSMLVFIPAIGEFVIPTLLGGPDNLMIGRVLWDEFSASRLARRVRRRHRVPGSAGRPSRSISTTARSNWTPDDGNRASRF